MREVRYVAKNNRILVISLAFTFCWMIYAMSTFYTAKMVWILPGLGFILSGFVLCGVSVLADLRLFFEREVKLKTRLLVGSVCLLVVLYSCYAFLSVLRQPTF